MKFFEDHSRRSNSLVLALGASALLCTVQAAEAAVIVGWDIRAATSSSQGSTFSYKNNGTFNADIVDSGYNQNHLGTGGPKAALTGYHGNSNTTWSGPVGNGSTYSISSDKWTTGDYYMVEFDTTGYSDIQISWDQGRNASGPRDFALEVRLSTNTSSPTMLVDNYAVIDGGALFTGTTAWNATTYQSQFTRSVNLSTLGVLNGQNFSADNKGYYQVRFKALEGGSGTNRIDNIMVTGTAIPVPAPGVMALLGAAGLVGSRRRR